MIQPIPTERQSILVDRARASASTSEPTDASAYRCPNGEPNHHKPYGYLKSPERSEIALEFTSGRPAGS